MFAVPLFMLFNAVMYRHVHTGSAGRQVVSLEKAVNWSQAVLGCQELGPEYSVPLILSKTDLRAIEHGMTSTKVSRTWLALKRKTLPSLTWLDGSSYNEGDIEEKLEASSLCGIFLIPQPALEVDKCEADHYGYICEGIGGCATYKVSPVNCVMVHGRVYAYGCASHSWYDARNKCKNLKMDLAVLREEKDREYLKSRWLGKDQKHCVRLWVGLRKEEWLQQGQALPGSVLAPWGPGQPYAEGECTVMAIGGISGAIWQTSDCSHLNTAICIANQFGNITEPLPRTQISIGSSAYSPMTETTSVIPTRNSGGLAGSSLIMTVLGAVAVFIAIGGVVGFLIRRKACRRKNKDTPVRTRRRWPLYRSHHNDVVLNSTLEPMMPWAAGRAIVSDSTALIAVLAAELHKMSMGRATRDEITLRIYVFKAIASYELSQDIESVVKGVVVREDLQFGFPMEENAEFTLQTEISLDDKETNIKRITTNEMTLGQVLRSALPGRLVAEFVVTGKGKKKLYNFRTYIKFTWKADDNTERKGMQYTEVIDREVIKSRQNAILETISLPVGADSRMQPSTYLMESDQEMWKPPGTM